EWMHNTRPVKIQDPKSASGVRTVKALYGEALNPDTQEWQQCVVPGVRERDGRLLVIFSPAEGSSAVPGMVSPSVPRGGKSRMRTMWLSRLYVYLWGDDPRRFAQRLGAAYRERATCESLLRHSLYVGSMPLDGLPQPEEGMMDRIKDLSLLKRIEPLVEGLSEQARANAKTLGLTILDPLMAEVLEAHLAGCNTFLFQRYLEREPYVVMEQRLERAVDRLAREKAAKYSAHELTAMKELVPVWTREDYDRNQEGFMHTSLLTHPKAVRALILVKEECDRVLAYDPAFKSHAVPVPAYCLFYIAPPPEVPIPPTSWKVLSLEDFKLAQGTSARRSRAFLKDNWTTFV
ncbi:hypothetical protein KIPB_011138, partial [Kipferlia bialata]